MSIFNSLYIAVSKSTYTLASLLMSVMVARALGPFEFGLFALVLSIFMIFELLGILGIDNIIIRDVAQDHSKSNLFFTHGAIVGVITSAIFFIMIVAIGQVMHYELRVKHLLLLVSSILLPAFLSFLIESIFIAMQKTKYVLLSALYRDGFLLIVGYWVLSQGRGIEAVVIVMLMARIIGLLSMMVFAKRENILLFSSFNRAFFGDLVKVIPTFSFIGMSTSIYLEMDTLILSKVLPLPELGIYSLAKRIFRLGNIFYSSVALAFFPLISQTFLTSRPTLKALYRRLSGIILGLSLVLVVIALTCSPFFIKILFGEQYMPAMTYLSVLIWALVPFSLEFLMSRFLIAGHMQKENLICLLWGIGCLLVTGIYFSSQWQGLGMAAAYTFSTCVMAGMAYYYVHKLFKIKESGYAFKG
jgi:O-antigen/teichoic acid export membrane protein